MTQPEKILENQILGYLKYRQIFAFKIKTVGTYDPKLQRFRKPSPWYRRGVSDIVGIYRGKPFAIEVKSRKGVLTEEQKLFLLDWQKEKGLALVARSLEDVESFFNPSAQHWSAL